MIMIEPVQISNEEKEELRQWAEKQGFERLSGGGWIIGSYIQQEYRQFYEENPYIVEKYIRFFKEENMNTTVGFWAMILADKPELFKTLDEN